MVTGVEITLYITTDKNYKLPREFDLIPCVLKWDLFRMKQIMTDEKVNFGIITLLLKIAKQYLKPKQN